MQCTADLLKSNSQLNCELKLAQKRYHVLEEAATASSKEVTQLKECVDKLHGCLTKRCDLEGISQRYYIAATNFHNKFCIIIDENILLKNQMAAMKESASQLEQKHQKQMEEAMEDLQRVKETHKKEIQEAQEKTKQRSKLEHPCDYHMTMIVIPFLMCSAASDRVTGEKR